jgi:PleD family two-component response regulator
MPFGFVGVENPTSGALIWGGCSVAVRRSDDAQGLTDMLVALTSSAEGLKQRVLCVDDDPDVTNFIDATLSDAGFAVMTLNEPIKALDAAKTFGPDAIILDVMMPGISGFDVCRGLKTHEASAGKPVLFLTASYDASSRALAYKAGGEDFIAKPVIREELITRLRTFVPPIPDRLGAGGAALLDRLLFMDTVNQFMSIHDAAGTVLLIQVEDAQAIESKYGALAPEIVSTILARLISIRFRPQDLRTQLDRDRFSVFMPDITSIQEREIVSAINAEIASLYFPSGNGDKFVPKIHVSASPVAKPVKA